MEPTNPVFPNAPRCRAQSKRTGRQCRAPALSGTDRCRFHRPWRPKGARKALPIASRTAPRHVAAACDQVVRFGPESRPREMSSE